MQVDESAAGETLGKEVRSREDLVVGNYIIHVDSCGFVKKMKISFVGKGKVFCISEDEKYEDTLNFAAFFGMKKERVGTLYISEK